MGLANQGTCVLVCIIDLEAGQYIWADVESQRSLPTLENTADRSIEVLRALVEGTRMSMYELLTLHAQARGSQGEDAAQADMVFRWEDFVTDYAQAAEYMGA